MCNKSTVSLQDVTLFNMYSSKKSLTALIKSLITKQSISDMFNRSIKSDLLFEFHAAQKPQNSSISSMLKTSLIFSFVEKEIKQIPFYFA